MVVDGAALDAMLHGAASDPRRYLERFGYAPPPLDDVDETAPPLDAEVNHGRWVWLCPCRRGSEADPPLGGGVVFVERPLGWCPRCANVESGGRWRVIRLPSERVELEALLALRPDPETRNWWPGETTADLAEQNAREGV